MILSLGSIYRIPKRRFSDRAPREDARHADSPERYESVCRPWRIGMPGTSERRIFLPTRFPREPGTLVRYLTAVRLSVAPDRTSMYPARPPYAPTHDSGGRVGTFNVQRVTFNLKVPGVARPSIAPLLRGDGGGNSTFLISHFEFSHCSSRGNPDEPNVNRPSPNSHDPWVLGLGLGTSRPHDHRARGGCSLPPTPYCLLPGSSAMRRIWYQAFVIRNLGGRRVFLGPCSLLPGGRGVLREAGGPTTSWASLGRRGSASPDQKTHHPTTG